MPLDDWFEECFEEEEFWKFLPYEHGSHLGSKTRTIRKKNFLTHSMKPSHEIWLQLTQPFQRCFKVLTNGWTMADNRTLLYYKLNLRAFAQVS